MVDVRRNLLILILMLAMIVTFSYMLMADHRSEAVSASLRLTGNDVEALAQTVDRSPFHRKRAEEVFVLLTREGDRAFEAENWTLAGEAYAKALRLSPGDAGLLQQYAKVLYLQHRFGEAIIALDQRRQAVPLRVEAHTDLALALFRAGRVDESKAVLGGALDVLPDEDAGPVYFLASCVHGELGEREQSHQMLAAAQSRLSPGELRYASLLWQAQSKVEAEAAEAQRRETLRSQAVDGAKAESE